MSVLYLPGCTLKNKAANFDLTMTRVMDKLGIQMTELARWNCCGTSFSMTSDDLMQHIAPIRNLLHAEQQGPGPLLVPCSMCYNTLKRSQAFIAADPERLSVLNQVMYKEESSYQGRMEVVHPLSYLRDQYGFDKLHDKVCHKLDGLKLAAYYGCLLTRPKEVAIDDATRPSVFEDMLQALGAQAVRFDMQSECCGSYQTLLHRGVTLRRTDQILGSARKAGAQALVTSCPLCAYNLDHMQREAIKEYPNMASMPVFYFSEMMAIALGVEWEPDWDKMHQIDPQPLLSMCN